MAQHFATAQDVELHNPVAIEPFAVPLGETHDVELPPLPPKPDKVILLRFRAVIATETYGGCNYNASVEVNSESLGAKTAADEDRLIGKEPSLTLAQGEQTFPVMDGHRLMVMFAPDVETGDKAATDGMGATFVLDISDMARGVDGNTVTFRNRLPTKPRAGSGDLIVEDLVVGWADADKLPQPVHEVPERGPVGEGIRADGLELAVSKGGGFVVRTSAGLELLVETSLGREPAAASDLVADDSALERVGVTLSAKSFGPMGHQLQAEWPGAKLLRTLELTGGLVHWKEQWTNVGDEIAGVPFAHRVFLHGQPARFHVGGSDTNAAYQSCVGNPTLFLSPIGGRGQGLGITAESDWLRLLMGLRARRGVGEIYSDTLALAPGKSVAFEWTLTPVAEGGYWTFINSVRRRWGANGLAMERPLFWGYARAADVEDPVERTKRSLAHLGSIVVCLGPWQRLEPDARVVRSGRYPKLAEGADRAPGKCPDLDVDAFLTFDHREVYWSELKKHVALIREAAPNAKIIQMIHPAMETVYKPLLERWPNAADVIRTADGSPFEAAHYSRAWVGDMVDKDWGVLYFVPRPGSAQLDAILEGMRRGMDEVGLDGIYSDEFSWASWQRGYSRYDYSRWDGHSADLDEEGNVVRLKCDGGFVTEPAQLQMLNEVSSRGKFFLGNGPQTRTSHRRFPHHRFVEGGNGRHTWPSAHLHPVPLVLGNMGDKTTTQGVFDSVKECLKLGCVYSPPAVNLLLEGDDNFVCKLYPMTVRELGPGWIVGEERIATIVSRTFSWPEADSEVRLFAYDSRGKSLEDHPRTIAAKAGQMVVRVPDRGLVIAELQTKRSNP